MFEINKDAYNSQISIPPSFPYVLRQFAKAAIRSQPNDLLKWSTTYFRCLSLNIPPPVKPRLEYPIPANFNGLTPGWLKALVKQMDGSHTVSFSVLCDRWMGACLCYSNLLEILCLGGFNDISTIPWFRFVGLCTGHMTYNLTETMIVICDILTDEPDGGSSKIRLEVFLDLYGFLARIDASKSQIFPNYHFPKEVFDSFNKSGVDNAENLKEKNSEENDGNPGTEKDLTIDIQENIVENEEVKETLQENNKEEDVSKPEEAIDENERYQEIAIEAIPGIGPIIPEDVILSVSKYMREIANLQDGLVMPRNIAFAESPQLS